MGEVVGKTEHYVKNSKHLANELVDIIVAVLARCGITFCEHTDQ